MIVIGEKINATRKSIQTAIAEQNREVIVSQIQAQDSAGAHCIDLNAGNPDGDIDKEADDMCWLIDIALEQTQKTLVLDSASADVIRKGAEHINGRRDWILNSVKNDASTLDALIPIAVQYNAPVIALAMDHQTIPETMELRMENCLAIRNKADEMGLKEDMLYFDPLVMPLSSDNKFGKMVLNTLKQIKTEFHEAKTTMGLSNVSFGLPNRQKINSAFLIAAVANGLDSAFCDPTRPEIKQAVLLASLVCGKDRFCRRYTRSVRNGVFEDSK
jgi:5-methyltetrahydrofolate corrinoid/iron sulfur protein methyltransferase